MDAFLQRRMADGRYRLQTSMRPAPRTAVTSWYESSAVTSAPGATAVVMGEGSVTRHNAAMTESDKGGSKKLKRKKGGGGEFTESEKKRLRNRESSDDSDSGGCWSGYESVEGVPKGKKGSCRKKSGGD